MILALHQAWISNVMWWLYITKILEVVCVSLVLATYRSWPLVYQGFLLFYYCLLQYYIHIDYILIYTNIIPRSLQWSLLLKITLLALWKWYCKPGGLIRFVLMDNNGHLGHLWVVLWPRWPLKWVAYKARTTVHDLPLCVYLSLPIFLVK